MKHKAKILLVEDDDNLGELVKEYLEMLEYDIHLTTNGEEGWTAFSNNHFDLCILDVMLPKKDGFTLATQIREINEQVPVIFLTARGQKDDKVKGFKAGCDDYITKPFSSEELALRIEAILKRCGINNKKTNEIIRIGKYTYDTFNLLLTKDDITQKLTVKEGALLRLLATNMNKMMPRETAQKEVWGTSDYFIGRSMDVFITRLRKYLRLDPDVCIQNIHGSGFKLYVKNEVEA